MFAINPRTHCKIIIGKGTWRSLTGKEKEEGVRLYKESRENKDCETKEESKGETSKFIINPRTNCKIAVGKGVWKTLTTEEKEKGLRLYKESRSNKDCETKGETDKFEEVQFVINPRTNCKITVGRGVWKSLTEEERKNALPYKVSKLEECNICLEQVKVKKNTTSCCKQIFCRDCYIKSSNYCCPFCRARNPYKLNNSEKVKKNSIVARYRRDDVQAYEAEYRAQIANEQAGDEQAGDEQVDIEDREHASYHRVQNPFIYDIEVINLMLVGNDVIRAGPTTLVRHFSWRPSNPFNYIEF